MSSCAMQADKYNVASQSRTAVILAGGRGTRLRPFTTSFPKPLVPVGDHPILEILIGQLVRDGFGRLILAVGHLAGLIEAYFGDGSRFGVAIEYVREHEPLGTAGPLRTIEDDLPSDFLVINGDVLSDLDYGHFLREHKNHDRTPILSISTHRRVLNSEYGVIESDDTGAVTDYLEKPSYELSVSEGVYAFSHETLRWIPPKQKFDFPDLVVALLAARKPVVAVMHQGLWLDIGRPDDYERAQEMVSQHPHAFLPQTETTQRQTRPMVDIAPPPSMEPLR